MFAQKAAISTVRQLTHVQAPDHASLQGYWSSPNQRIGKFFPDEQNEYMLSKQYSGDMSSGGSNYFYMLFFVVSSVVVLRKGRELSPQLLFVYGAILLFFLVNAFVTSVGSTVIYRFQYRIFWVLPAINAIVIAGFLAGQKDGGNKRREINKKMFD